MATAETTEIETETDPILCDVADGIATLTFNNPARLNAMSLDMWLRSAELLQQLAEDSTVRVIVLTGAGDRAFVSGADISKFESERSSEDHLAAYEAAVTGFHRVMTTIRKPTIAKINGYCIGGGLAIAIDCDMRICSQKSTFGVPAAKLGVGYKFNGIRQLLQLVGASFTAEIFYTARQFDAEEAKVMGLVNRVVAEAGLESFVQSTSERIAGNAPLSIATVKQTLIELAKYEPEQDSALCDELVKQCFHSNDYIEGRTAFMEKRRANFTGS